MKQDSPQWKTYLRLKDPVLQGQADEETLRELESLVLSDAEIRRDFTERLHLDAALQFGTSANMPSDLTDGMAISHPSDGAQEDRDSVRVFSRRYLEWLAVAAALLLGVGFWLAGRSASGPQVLAVMGKSDSCKWVSSDSPTFPGASLVQGRMILDTGIATLRFDHVDLTLEGPVDFELLDPRRCRVRSGRVYAEVHPGGEGFVVETPTSILVDRGTRFGVNVSLEGTSDLTVLEGLVDAEHRSSGKVTKVRPDAGLRLTEREMVALEDASQEINGPVSIEKGSSRYQPVQITTAVGGGRDGYVISGEEKPESNTDGLLLVKNPPRDSWDRHWRRRAYMHFDLTLLERSAIRTATLQLHGVKSGMGYLSLTPDTVFSVYGLADESAENWSEDELDWENCPGVGQDRSSLDADQVLRLGRFTVPSHQPDGVFEVEGEALAAFLRNDQRGGVTLIIESETYGRGESYVHGFAGKRHHSLPPPSLRLGVEKAETRSAASETAEASRRTLAD